MSARDVLDAIGFLVLTTAAAACGDLYADPVPAPVQSPSPSASVVVSTPPPAADVVDTRSACQDQRPTSNSPCFEVGQTCEYGTSPDSRCNELLVCQQTDLVGGWLARPWSACSRDLCPEAGKIADLDGTPCSLAADGGSEADDLACAMLDGFCACTTGPDAAHTHERRWSCQKPDPGCPVQRPLVGQSCTRKDLTCDYGSCVFKEGRRMTCNGVRWDTGDSSCND